MCCTPDHSLKLSTTLHWRITYIPCYKPFILNDMKTTEDWLKEKVLEYEQDPKEALKNILATTNDVMLQYKNNPTSIAAKGVFDACIEHNKLFLIEVGVISAD